MYCAEFRASLVSQPGDVFEFETSSDLAVWHPWRSMINRTGILQWEDATPGPRFYRARTR